MHCFHCCVCADCEAHTHTHTHTFSHTRTQQTLLKNEQGPEEGGLQTMSRLSCAAAPTALENTPPWEKKT